MVGANQRQRSFSHYIKKSQKLDLITDFLLISKKFPF